LLDSDNFTEGNEENEGWIARELGELTRKAGSFFMSFRMYWKAWEAEFL